MQFIFVDDASSDDSVARLEQTLERYSQRKSQTIILHLFKNMGLPTARATGLAYVEAPYVAHCDSDDYVEPTMYEKLYECALQNDADMVICGRTIHRVDGRVSFEFASSLQHDDGLIRDLLYGRLSCSVWDRLTRTEIYRRVHFPKGNSAEDLVQTVQLLTYAKRICFLKEALYHYNQRPMSITTDMRRESMSKKMEQHIANFFLMHEFILAHFQIEENDFVLQKIAIYNNYLPYSKGFGIQKRFFQVFPELLFGIFFNRMFSLHFKMIHLLIILGLYPTLKSFYDFTRRKFGGDRTRHAY